jgi:hypothetical protein
MAPPLLSGGRKRKRGRREKDKRGSTSGARGVCEPSLQERSDQREAAQEPGAYLLFFPF